jgi:hypothetical protein
VFVFAAAVPALLVVVLGYVVGHGLWTWLAGLVGGSTGTTMAAGAEVAGWLTGALMLVVTLRVALAVRRGSQRRRRNG